MNPSVYRHHGRDRSSFVGAKALTSFGTTSTLVMAAFRQKEKRFDLREQDDGRWTMNIVVSFRSRA